jgi:diguanylate cyclase (GGDEF)-like protein
MEKDNNLLKIISNETKNTVNNISIVTPSIYESIFSKIALEHHADLENEKELSQTILDLECSNLEKLQALVATNAVQLSQNTSRAIDAIKSKDDSILKEVLLETQLLRKEIENLKESLYRDELTNAYNRKWFHDNYTDMLNFKKDGSMVLIDLNYFKSVNDTHGHIIGDKVLVFITNQFKKLKCDVVRYGGDEFILLFSKEISKLKAFEIVNEMREDILSKKLKAHDSFFRTSFSIGVSTFKKGYSITKVTEDADQEMYRDKENIKKRITGIEI